MKIFTVLCNVGLALFTCLVLATDGASAEPAHIVLTLLLILIPVANVLVVAGSRSIGSGRRRGIERAVVMGNVALVGFAGWAILDQYPHPAEPGFIEYAVLVMLTPVLSIVTILRHRAGGSRPSGEVAVAR